jgi:hypothetical protein
VFDAVCVQFKYGAGDSRLFEALEIIHLNLEVFVPDWFQCVFLGFSALYFVLGLTNEQGNKRICLANEVGVLDVLGFNHCHVQFPNWVKLQEAASSNADI